MIYWIGITYGRTASKMSWKKQDLIEKTENKTRASFSGRMGFVLSAAGASVGLGNIWRFPYLAAKYGGGIFLLI